MRADGLLNSALAQLKQISNTANVAPHLPMPVDSWQAAIKVAMERVQLLEEWLWKDDRVKENPGERGGADYRLLKARSDATDLQGSITRLRSRLDEIDVKGDTLRAGLVVGAAGTGKSHLLADGVSNALGERRPALLILGQYFNSQDLFRTILDKLGVPSLSRDEVLGALDAAAEAARTRCLILVDALNDAHDLKYLRDHIGSFVDSITQYQHLGVALSCRSEYEKTLMPDSLRKKLIRVECHGFTSYQEQENAARQYLEKRGIVRPATPWLVPEFRNPLFLRTCCEALHRAGKREFPRGLRGIKEVLQFYVESIENSLRCKHPGIHIVTGAVSEGLTQLAKRMAKDKVDCVAREAGEKLVSKAFGNRGPSQQNSWLDILIREGVLRRDLESTDASQPLTLLREQIRFAYQRFSDHLIVSALLAGSPDPAKLFKHQGTLSFLITGKGIQWKFQSLLPALATQIPERFRGRELLDLLPGGAKKWLKYPITEAFAESILWRSKDAFAKRTLELFNALGRLYSDPRLTHLLQLSVVSDHPWNAAFLDRNLRKKKMAQRDAFWSVPVAKVTHDDEHPLHGLIDWALRADKTLAERETLRLTSLVLIWCFSTSSRPIRDRATKALSAILIRKPDLFPELLYSFARIDDLYVLERLCAAGFGAACHDIGSDALSAMAGALFKTLFKQGRPPLNLLMRDYALAPIELANERGCLPKSVDLELCRPPYDSLWPLKNATERDIDRVRKAAGDDTIYYSACGYGDFARYEIETRFDEFSSVLLSESCPLNEKQKLEKFRTKMTDWTEKKQAAFAALEAAVNGWKSSTSVVTSREPFSMSIRCDQKLAKKAEQAERRLVMLLSPSEKSSYERLALPALFPDRAAPEDRGIPKFDLHLVKRWITKRAYDFGWTKGLFPEEPRGGMNTDRPQIERVGKKYQWLARSELLARLADNVWMIRRWRDEAFVYGHPCHTDFVRDIEPTILASVGTPSAAHSEKMWWFPRSITYRSEPDQSVARWPFEGRDLINSPDLIEVRDSNEQCWVVLFSFYHADDRPLVDKFDLPFRRTAFVRVSSIIVRARDSAGVMKAIRGKRLTDPTEWNPRDVVDGPFYLEYPWRSTWSGFGNGWVKDELRCLGNKSIPSVKPVIDYTWESQLDSTLPNGSRIRVPSLWLTEQLGLNPRSSDLGKFEDSSGKIVFLDPSVGTGLSRAALVNRDVFLKFLNNNQLECLWIVAGEKSAHFSRDAWGRRWHSGAYRYGPHGLTGRWWYGDDSQGLGKNCKSRTLPSKSRR